MYAEALAEDREDQIDESLRNHIVNCERCEAEVFDLCSSIERFQKEQKSMIRRKYKFYSISAAASILILICAYIINLILTVDRFELNNNLEVLVAQDLRSVPFKLIEPEIYVTISSEEITFDWESDEKDLTLILLDNQENILISKQVSSLPVSIINEFSDGLIYWKVETQNKLVYMSKFKLIRDP